jgi:pimeloyl-ACP methyl ester carboxylesterase
MGSSSRPAFTCETGDEADLYCMEFLEKWRIAMKDLNYFVLVGHSYGGYLAGTYASLYPQFIRKLILLSPLGLKKRPLGYESIKNMRFQNARGPPKWALSLTASLWGKVTPFAIARKLSESRVRKILAGYVRRH